MTFSFRKPTHKLCCANHFSIVLCVIATILLGGTSRIAALDITQQITRNDLNSALNTLDSLIDLRTDLYAKREKTLAKMSKMEGLSKTDSIKRLIALADNYYSYCSRYALTHANKAEQLARQIHNDSLAVDASFLTTRVLARTKLVKETIDRLALTDTTALSAAQLAGFYKNAAIAYASIMLGLTEFPIVMESYRPQLDFYYKKTMANKFSPDQQNELKLLEAVYFFLSGDNYASADLARSVLSATTPENLLYGEAAQLLARCYQARGGELEQSYYLTLAAISAVKRADRESLALSELGNFIFNDPKLSGKAHNYLQTAIEYAPHHKQVNRADILIESIANLEKGYQKRWQSNVRLFWFLIAVILLSSVLLALLLVRNRRNYKRLHDEKELVASANNNKEVFMKNFLEMCVLSTERMSDFCRLASRKITAKQIDELYEIIHSGRIMDAQRKEFLRLFDKSFLQAFPTFIDELNLLLRPEERYVFAENQEHLPPELRVYAMVRLGIDDVSRMAKSMGYSTNTVYVYRGKVKAKAINKQTFDADSRLFHLKIR